MKTRPCGEDPVGFADGNTDRALVLVFDSKDKVLLKDFKNATPWETLHWYAKKGAAKIGVKWD